MRLFEQFKRYSAAGVIAFAAGGLINEAYAQTAPKAVEKTKALSNAVFSPTYKKAFVEKTGSYLVYGGDARPVAAFTKLCNGFSRHCTKTSDKMATIVLDPLLLFKLETTNAMVNKSIKPLSDMTHWGVADRWDEAEDGSGDCEDFQLKKKRILQTVHGVDPATMIMAVVIDKNGEGHAVLVIQTDKGDLVLDNHTDAVLFVGDTNYKFRRGVQFGPQQWKMIDAVENRPPFEEKRMENVVSSVLMDPIERLKTFANNL